MSRIHAVLFSALLAAGSASATTIFFTDFNSGAPSEISGSSGVANSVSVGGTAAIDGLQLWQNYSGGNPGTATTLTLTGLAANQSLDLDFTFLAIGSWDGTTYAPGTYAPDYFDVNLNSASIFHGAFRNYGTGGNPEYPGCPASTDCTSTNYPAPPANTTITLQQSATGDFGTSIYHIAITGLNANSSGNAVFSFFGSGVGWQGSGDESIGLDNINVTAADAAATPEPSTWALIGGALLCLPLIRRRAFGR
jgi:hypothetical protein